MRNEGKCHRVYIWLREYIDKQYFAENKKLPSETIICRKLNVSRDTVRKALALLHEENLIIKMKGSGTYINKSAVLTRNLNPSNAAVKVGMILQGQDKSANDQLLKGVRTAFRNEDSQIRVFYTDNRFSNERDCLNLVMHQDLNGLIIDGVKASLLNPNLDCYYKLYRKKIPAVFYNNYYKELEFPRVINDDIACADALIRLLTEAGHHHIAGVFIYDNYQSIEKFKGFTRSLMKYGGRFDDSYVKWAISGDVLMHRFQKDMIRFLKDLPKCTAIVCCNYIVLRQVSEALRQWGKSVPEDYSLVCFDYSGEDIDSSEITCSVHRSLQIGTEAGRLLLDIIHGKQEFWSGDTKVIKPLIHTGKTIRDIRKH